MEGFLAHEGYVYIIACICPISTELPTVRTTLDQDRRLWALQGEKILKIAADSPIEGFNSDEPFYR